MLRSARLTVLELGASASAWASCHALGADDWIVVAQQSDEAAPDFTQRIRQRAHRLRKEGAQLDAVDVYAGPGNDQSSSAARREVIEDLGDELSTGGRFTLWSSSHDLQSNAELSAILAEFRPILAERQIALNHQACETEERSGVRHAVPERSGNSELVFEELACAESA